MTPRITISNFVEARCRRLLSTPAALSQGGSLDWNTLSELPLCLPRSRVRVHLIALSSSSSASALDSGRRSMQAITDLRPKIVAIETSVSRMQSHLHTLTSSADMLHSPDTASQAEPLPRFLAEEMVRSGSHLFAFPPAIGNSTSSAAAVKETLQICLDAARSASALTKAIDVDSNCLANPNHALASHISTLTSLYSLPPLENVRSTAASRLLYRLTMPSSIDSDEDLHAQQRYLRAWCMLHPKERYYLVDLRVAIMCRRLHALAMAAHARDSAGYSGVTSDYPIIVALLGKWSILGVRHMWQRFVESADPVPASHGRFRVGVTAKTQPEYYCEIDQQVLKLGDVRVLRDDYKHILEVRAPCPKEFENNRLSPVQLSRPNVQIIQGSRSKIQRRQNTPIV